MKKPDPFPALLRAFFYEWLAEQRNASVHTVRSYRDTWRLFLRFVAERRGCKVAQISLADLTGPEVGAFLHHAEHDRQGTIGTRNCRLAAIRSFFNFVAAKEPTAIAQCTEILGIPVKRAPIPAPCYLEPMEVTAILAQVDRSTPDGMRDMRCSPSFTTVVHASRRRSICAQRRYGSRRRAACAFMARGARSASVRSGRKQ